MRIAVCVLTYRRPEGLERLLHGLDGLLFEGSEPSQVKVIVIDNDAGGSARALCEKAASRLRWPLEYHVEPRRGISQARNKAIASAIRGGADCIAFIDDDEVPEPDWLDRLMHAQRAYGADVVSGPVPARFDGPVPEWVVKGKFFEQTFERPRHPTGHQIELANTGNVLIRAGLFEEMGEAFDERMGLTGGEDTLFFARVHRAGYRMVWADDAVAHEWTSRDRANLSWILKRAYRLGNALSLFDAYSGAGPRARIVRLAKGGGRIVQGLLLLPLSVPLSVTRGPHELVKPLLYVYRGVGMLAGLAGMRYEAYR